MTSGQARDGNVADESTPLISGSLASHFGFRNDSHSYDRSIASSTVDDEEEDVDINELSLSLARVGSFASGTGLEPGITQYVKERPRTVQIAKVQREPSVVEAPDLEEAGLEEDATDKQPSDPRFINIAPRKFWAIFSIAMLAYFVACFDSTLMASSHPVITSYFNASQAAPWLSTVFLITSTAFQPLFGRLSDMVGRKWMITVSLMIFALTTLWCALATSIESFIAARAACGIGAGGAMALSLIIVSDLVRIEYRGVFQSHINVSFGMGSASGAAFGGYLCDSLGWRWSFGVQVPVLIVCLIMAVLLVPSDLGPMLIKHDEGSPWEALKSFDSRGSVLLITTITCLILALNLGGNIFPWISPVVITCAVIFVISAAFFVWREMKAKHPLMPLRLLSHSPISNLVFSNFFGAIASNTVLFNVPLFFQAVLLTSAANSGFRLAAPSLAASSIGVCTGYIITYTRKLRPTLIVGGVLYLLGAVIILFMNRHVSEVTSLLFIIGVPVGQGFLFPSTIMSALAVSKQEEQAVVTTTVGLWRNLGTVMGVAVSSLVFQNSLVANLNKMVTGPDREAIIREVRSSVKSIKLLEPAAQAEGK